ncbi:hypothetical protein GQ44DRAFT_757462 [Phaeosphaeriaceae sp. PMI808]|nr:hypothetical protein GQ44DRAFT_757462 [Phaeosphaeriaceae sp. PMI808]
MTITHKSEIIYGIDFLQTVMWLPMLKYYGPTRLVVIYKSPLPRTQMLGITQINDSSVYEELLLQQILREPENGDQANSKRGVFLRPLEEEAFKKHMEGLGSY